MDHASGGGAAEPSRFTYRRPWGVIALALLFAALFGWSELRLRAMREELSEIGAAQRSLNEERWRLEKSNRQLTAEVRELGGAERTIDLAGPAASAGVRARVFLLGGGGEAVVLFSGVAEGTRYDVAVTRAHTPEEQKVAKVGAGDNGRRIVIASAPDNPLKSITVTADGSTEPVLSGSF